MAPLGPILRTPGRKVTDGTLRNVATQRAAIEFQVTQEDIDGASYDFNYGAYTCPVARALRHTLRISVAVGYCTRPATGYARIYWQDGGTATWYRIADGGRIERWCNGLGMEPWRGELVRE